MTTMPHKVTEVYAWIGKNNTGQHGTPEDDDESICAYWNGEMGVVAMVVTRRELAEFYRPMAERICKQDNRQLRLVKFSKMEVLETIG
jgi:hypothetical protein